MHIVIIGNGVAGTSAAFTIKDRYPEIDVSLFSREDLPEYSACALTHYIGGFIKRERVFLKSQGDYVKHNIRAYFCQEIVKIDTKEGKVYTHKQGVPYDKLVIATGSDAIVPKIVGTNKRGVFVLKSLRDADNIVTYPKKRVVVIGSGPIGVQASIALKQSGASVYLVELQSRILPTIFDQKGSAVIRDILESNRIKVLTGEKVIKIFGGDKVEGVVTDRQSMKCDMVLLAVGMKPNVDLAVEAGLAIGELGGIKVNREMMTSMPDIYACGDCIETRDLITGNIMLSLKWYSARMQGMITGYNCVGKHVNYLGSPNITTMNVFGIDAVSIGSTEETLNRDSIQIMERGYGSHYCKLLFLDNVIKGAQLINAKWYAGTLFNAMVRKVNVNMIRGLIDRKSLAITPLMIMLANYLREIE